MTHDQVLRTGVLFKKGSGNGPFGRKNWKPRYFVLTPKRLQYYTYEEGELKGELDLTGCNEQSIEVMPADAMKTGSSASTIWRVAVNTADRRLIVAAGTELEMNDWVEQFLLAFRINSGQAAFPEKVTVATNPVVAGGAITSAAGQDFARNSMTDFHNFAAARRSVGGAMRSSMGVHPGHEFRLSDEHERQKQAEMERMERERQLAEQEAERHREEEILRLHLIEQEEQRRRAEEARRRAQDDEAERQRHEELLERQRQQKREQHERERLERERHLLEQEQQRQAMEQQRQAMEQQMQDHERKLDLELLEVLEVDGHSSKASTAPTERSSSSSARSSMVGEAKREAMLRQQQEHARQREATIKQQQAQLRSDFLAQQRVEQEVVRKVHVRTPPASPPKPIGKSHQASPPATPPRPTTRPDPAFNPAASIEF
ncbi:hypothetical protein ATCC90586_001776 [Pythium insidiosum]|nr:hypothetical protein ATCC90586_001776 [Pythium insidiosum]